MLQEIWSLVGTIITAGSTIMVAALTRNINRRNKLEEQRDARRKEENILQFQMLDATMELSLACCNALTGGHNNGNVEEAKKKALSARGEYLKFEQRVLAEELI